MGGTETRPKERAWLEPPGEPPFGPPRAGKRKTSPAVRTGILSHLGASRPEERGRLVPPGEPRFGAPRPRTRPKKKPPNEPGF